MLKSSGAGPPFPLMTSVSLTMVLSVTVEEGGVRAGRPFPLPLSDEESSERRRRDSISQIDKHIFLLRSSCFFFAVFISSS